MTARNLSTETETTMKIEQHRLSLESSTLQLPQQIIKESSPIKWIVEEREDAKEIIRVELLVVVSHLQLVFINN